MNPLLWVIPVLFFLNGLNPYLGLNTENSYAVFSNLRTELHRSNHLLVRKTAYLSSCQTDYVKVLETSRELPKRIALQKMVSQCELRNTIAEMAKKVKSGEVLRIRYLKNEEEVIVENAYADPYFSKPYPYLVRKLMRFKPVDEDAESLCKH